MTKIVKTNEYEASHGRQPRGDGLWLFRNADTGDVHEHTGTYTQARASLPAGTWVVLP
jgi:hypothetical protein